MLLEEVVSSMGIVHGLNTVGEVWSAGCSGLTAFADLANFVRTSAEIGKPVIGVSIK